jgi:serine/threonine protein kinase
MVILVRLKLTLVLFSEFDGYWKIADFGFTQQGSSTREIPSVNSRGTTGYRAPELVRENATFNNKVDIWAFGCILFEMCTGHKAFSSDITVYEYSIAETELTMFKCGPFGPPEQGIAKLGQRIENWTMSLLALNPADRPSAQELARDINERIAKVNTVLAGD